MLPIPKQKDMDDLYREIYLLKKRIKALEKKSDH
jgi:polyhydroxyalkanoate synthesis regulator phasin